MDNLHILLLFLIPIATMEEISDQKRHQLDFENKMRSSYQIAKEYEKEANDFFHNSRERRPEPSSSGTSSEDYQELNNIKQIVSNYTKEIKANRETDVVSDKGTEVFSFSDRNRLKSKATEFLVGNRVPYSPSWYKATWFIPRVWVGNEVSESEQGKYNGRSALDVGKQAKSSEPETKLLSYFLHPETAPSINIMMDSNEVTYKFEVDPEVRNSYLISVVVEKMEFNGSGQGKYECDSLKSPILSIKEEDSEVRVCSPVDNTQNNFQSVKAFKDGDKQIIIQGFGEWQNVTANLVASIYYETNNCHNCTLNGHFCCGEMTSNRNSKHDRVESTKYFFRMNALRSVSTSSLGLYRCIPKKDREGNSLICNGHPNCGFSYNKDELRDNCPRDGDECSSYYYCRDESQPDRVFIMILLLVLFCLFVPFCIFIFFCSRKDLRREFLSGNRPNCPLPLEVLLCPFSINADSNVPPENVRPRSNNLHPVSNREQARRPRGNERRHVRRTGEVRPDPRIQPLQVAAGVENFSYFDDLPPPYFECCNNKELYPNPPKYSPKNEDPVVSSSSAPFRNQNSIETIALPERPLENLHANETTTPNLTHSCSCNTSMRASI